MMLNAISFKEDVVLLKPDVGQLCAAETIRLR